MTTHHEKGQQQRRSGGGPRTAAGKAASRNNSTRHGLTSKKLLPEVLDKDRVNELRQQIKAQYLPGNVTERILVDEMARHAAMLELGEHAEGAVLRHGARELSNVILGVVQQGVGGSGERDDAILSAAVSTDAIDKFARYRRTHEKAFFAALNKLGDLQSARQGAPEKEKTHGPASKDFFATEQACEEHLRDRFRQPDWRCPRCGQAQGSWLKTRKRWECGSCHRQFGVRYATVMQGSRLPLRTWFSAITLMLSDPEVSTRTLADKLGLRRQATVRKLMGKIRQAMVANNAHHLLVGLVAPCSGFVTRGP